ncbi:hypothetical protein Amet_0548 [Alkaliphilus metalliredigens QYMF]|uniref:FMN-binding domain-containing protein n=1 Tax=Alkaliphilus metalliredigens (strain QYMF) TaxID=293826 RepID=A6TKQ7_ALKMQ|nr:hypothetical protein [Alkaliphilus metalliredigens]ABR46775.1 hypothetical protein Amet_0548 [Alkaliphilus metalliredigens QYMF]
MKMNTKFKKLLFIGVLAVSMVTLAACGGGAEDSPWEDDANENEIGIEEPVTNNEPSQAEYSEEEMVPTDGTYTAMGMTQDEQGQIEVELTVVDAQINDFKVIAQDGIELDESTVESFRAELLNNKAIEYFSVDEVSGEPQEIDVLMQATLEAYLQALLG